MHFTSDDLQDILFVTDVALKMQKVISALGMNMADDEQIKILQLRKKVNEMLDEMMKSEAHLTSEKIIK